MASSEKNLCFFPLSSVHIVKSSLLLGLGKLLGKATPTLTGLGCPGSAEEQAGAGGAESGGRALCARLHSALQSVPGQRAQTGAAAPGLPPQDYVGRTLSPALSGDEDFGEMRGSC